MKLKQLACLTALTLPFTANADFLSVSAGGGVWNTSPDGNFQKTSDPAAVNVKDNLFWDDESQGYLFISLEHFIPIIPNVKLVHTSIDQSGVGNTSFQFDGQTFNGDVDNTFAIDSTDLILYYEVLDNVVSLDIGLNIRNLKVDYTITSTGTTTTDSFNETVPMLYALVGVSPWPDLIISGELSYIAFEGSTISDLTAKVAYTTNFFIGLEAGYRIQEYEFDDVSDTDADLSFDGVFAGAYVKF
jgi:outer membrane protein